MNGFFSSSVIQKPKAEGLLPKCGACRLYKGCESPKMEVYGDGERGVMVVGEAPSQTEDEQGRPFVGKTGTLLRETLAEFDVRLDRDAWATNALICHPPNGATPDIKQISHCRPNLANAIAKYKPRVIIPLGRTALVSVMTPYWTDVEVMERWVGWKIPLKDHWICPTYHPSFILRMKNQLLDRLFYQHLRDAFKIKTDPPPQKDYAKQVEVVYDDRVVWDALCEIDGEGDWAAVDYETNCIKPEYPKAKIYSCAVSNGRRTISYLWTPKAREATGKFFRSKRTRKIASNAKFEERWTRQEFGHGVRNWGWDTMIAAHVLDNREKITSIKFQALVLLGVPTYNSHIEPYLYSDKDSPYNRIEQADVGQLLYYGGMDALLEHQVAMIQRREMGYED